MKKNSLVIISVLVLIATLSFMAVSKTGSRLLREFAKNKLVQVAPPQTETGGHAGHEAAPPLPPSQPEPEAKPGGGEEVLAVEIPLEKQQLIGVKTFAVSIMPLRKVVRTVGRIEYDERRLATVNTKIEGWIERLYVDYTGRYVKKGERLAEIYSPELYATQQEFLNEVRWSKLGKDVKADQVRRLLANDAGVVLEAARQRLRLWDITDDQIKKIEDTGKPIRTLTLYSPVNGYVVQKTVLQGMRVMAGEKLFDVADLSTVWIISDVYENELPLIKPGQAAAISLTYFPGKEFESKVDYVYPTLAGETRTAKVRFTVPNFGGQLKPQMFANVEVKIDLGKRLVVPEEAVINTGLRRLVYIDQGEGLFAAREVTTGLNGVGPEGGGMVEIIKGLRAGEKVASGANFLIDSESRLKGIVKE